MFSFRKIRIFTWLWSKLQSNLFRKVQLVVLVFLLAVIIFCSGFLIISQCCNKCKTTHTHKTIMCNIISWQRIMVLVAFFCSDTTITKMRWNRTRVTLRIQSKISKHHGFSWMNPIFVKCQMMYGGMVMESYLRIRLHQGGKNKKSAWSMIKKKENPLRVY